jgi:hypothetical protein
MNTKLFYYIVLAAWMALGACKSRDDKEAELVDAADSTLVAEAPDSGFATETIDTFNTTGFSTYAKQRVPAFDWSKFKLSMMWREDTLIKASYKPDKKFYAAYGPFIKWSPDSTKFIDLDSYNVEISKDKSGKLRGHELGPDTEVSLVDTASGQKTRLLFLGPGSSVEDALWLDSNNLVLMGVQDYGDSLGKTAAVWRYHIPTQQYTLYEQRDTAVARELMGYWKRERLKGVLN